MRGAYRCNEPSPIISASSLHAVYSFCEEAAAGCFYILEKLIAGVELPGSRKKRGSVDCKARQGPVGAPAVIALAALKPYHGRVIDIILC